MAKSLFITNILPRHEAIVTYEIQNPGSKQGEIAVACNVSESHLSVIYNSDAFIAYRAARMQEHHQNVSESVVEKTENLAKLSLDILHERFDDERNVVPLGGVKDTAAMALNALGFGSQGRGNTAPGVVIQVGADPELLANAREKMRTINAVVEVEEDEDPQLALPST